MNISIKKRIFISFSLLVFLFIVNGIATLLTLQKNKQRSENISTVIDPALQVMEEYQQLLTQSKMYATNWVFLRSRQEDRNALLQLHSSAYPSLQARLDSSFTALRNPVLKKQLAALTRSFDTVLLKEKAIMSLLQDFENYDDVVARMEAETLLEEEVLPRSNALLTEVSSIVASLKSMRHEKNEELKHSAALLRTVISVLATVMVATAILLSLYLAQIILLPLRTIGQVIGDLGKGMVRTCDQPGGKNEIGEMMAAVNHLSRKLQETARFAQETGNRNFNIPFTPLGPQDTLGKALLSMRDNLRRSEMELMANAEDLHKKDELLQAAALATYELISNEDFDEAIGKAVRLLGNRLQVDVFNVYKTMTGPMGEEFTDQLLRWTRVNDAVVYDDPGFRGLTNLDEVLNILRNNEIFQKLTADVQSPYLRALFEQRNIQSAAAIPVFAMNRFWGFVGFHDCCKARVWTATEISILTSFAVTMGAVIERKAIEHDMMMAKEAAEEASMAKSDFMANMSHELRTPMNGIIGFTDLVLTTPLQKNQRDYLSNVSKSAYNLLAIINDILDFSKMEAGKLAIDEVEFTLTDILEETADMLSIKAQEKNLELICQLDPALPARFCGDPLRIRQILVNLIGNAIKFTNEGEIVIKAAATAGSYEVAGKNWMNISIAVKDSGIGIAEDKLAAIFESFTQADASTTRRFGGTGLGLTISRQLAELMGGQLTVQSKTAMGSVFTLSLTLAVTDARAALPPRKLGALQHVLVVDDNSTNCALLQGVFDYLAIQCTVAGSGKEALLQLAAAGRKGRPVDLVITDHQMPGMDGIALAKEIKNQQQAMPLPVIMMLSSLEKHMIQEAAELCGIHRFLSKPVKLQELITLLSSMFENTQQESGNTSAQSIKRFSVRNKVLVAEDNPINMLLITEILTKMGMEVYGATDGAQVLSMLEMELPDLIFMDINMPVLDGYMATKKIRSMGYPHAMIPIIALTADAMKEDRERCLAVGMNAFVSKPFQLNEIESVLQKYLQPVLQLH
ncbi:MAG TPA: response regulator [Chitinophagaceae bacterium]|nr:response regulator [Chitinophagaceae bacterium]